MKTRAVSFSLCLLCVNILIAQENENNLTLDSLKVEKVVGVDGSFSEIFALDEIEEENESDELKEIRNKLDSLGKVVQKIQIGESDRISDSYKTVRGKLKNSLLVLHESKALYSDLIIERNKAEGESYILRANNPESGILGFKFSESIEEIIFEMVNDVDGLKENDKSIFKKGVGKLIGGLSNLVNPTGLIGDVIGFISGFTPIKVKDALNDPLGEDFIKTFKEKIRGFKTFYATLDTYNGKYGENLRSLDVKYSRLSRDFDNMIDDLNDIGVNIDLTSTELESFVETSFPESSDLSNEEMKSRLNGPIMQFVINKNGDVRNIVEDVTDYLSDYKSIVNSNYNRNIQLFDLAKKVPGADGDQIIILQTNIRSIQAGGKFINVDNGEERTIKENESFKNLFAPRLKDIATRVSKI